MSLVRDDYGLKTFLLRFTSGLGCGLAGGAAMCEDGRVRNLKRIQRYADGEARAAVSVYGKTVAGYVYFRSAGGYDTPTTDDPTLVYFSAFAGRKNWNAFSIPRQLAEKFAGVVS